MAYAQGPYETFTSLPPPPRPEVSSARKIDFARKRYILDETTGGYEAMSPTAQRVVVAVSFGVEREQFVTPQAHIRTEQKIREALKHMTSGQEPLIELRTASASRTAPGTSTIDITFREIGTTEDQTVQLV